MENELKSIIKWLKKKHVIVYFIVFIIIFVVYLNSNKEMVTNVFSTGAELFKIVVSHILSILIIFISIFGVRKCFKYSDIRSQENIDFLHKPIPKYITGSYVKIMIIEKNEEFNFERKKLLEISIKNKNNETINYIKGKVFIYDNHKRVMVVNFEVEHLRPSYSEIVFNDVISRQALYWNEANLLIDEIKIGDYCNKNIFVDGFHFFRTYTEILNYDTYYDYKFWGLKTKYNLVFLKEKMREFKRMIRFFWKRNTFSFTRRLKLGKKKIIMRIIIVFSIIGIIITFIFLMTFLILDIISIINELKNLIMK